jgi:acetamidase/formamidase
MRRRFTVAVAVLGIVAAPGLCAAQGSSVPPKYAADATLASTPANVVWGYIPTGVKPALTITSGQTVRIDTISHQGLLTDKNPVAYFGAAGIPPGQVLQDAEEVYKTVGRPKGGSAHVLTGPIYVDGAEPGDLLEVRILKIEHRVPYGVNISNKGSGVLPGLLSGPTPKIIKFDLDRKVALFSDDIEIPLGPFMGIMAVAPPEQLGIVSSRPPSHWGGNLDFKRLVAGSTLYLPVFNRGAQFYTGDAHAAQGDGEVNGTAIEASQTPTLQFILHKGKGRSMTWPRAEDAEHFYAMGLDVDLDVAMKHATQEVVDFLQREKGLSAADAYSLASLAVDFHVGEAVDFVQMVYGAIPKKIFKKNPEYWLKR